ncbi:MAG: hypothetical protein GF311_21095 [Candidatus Lokiarchaeota archaeon]|nr:hypothetical protein [Candidatus Lokiarchaeota archaeon]
MSKKPELLKEFLEIPLSRAIFERCSRRFGLQMEIPLGLLKYQSKSNAIHLSEFEESLLIATGTGVKGWSFRIPHGPAKPKAHADHFVRLTGRTLPTAAEIGAPVLFYTNDDGIYLTITRDVDSSPFSGLDTKEEISEWIWADII